MSESEASAQITGISGGFIGTLRLSERTGKNRMVCTITMAGVEELWRAGSCSSYFQCFPP
jgi:hypothetical protein